MKTGNKIFTQGTIFLTSMLALCIFCANRLSAAEFPHLERNENGIVRLMIEGKPVLMLAGELENSSGSTAESMSTRWERLKALNLNTILLAISWEQIEPDEGVYDFSEVEAIIRDARAHDMRLVILWFGSWKNGSSGYAPHWVMRDTKRFPRMKSSKGENRPFLSQFNDELARVDARAYTALMKRIREIDSQHHTVVMMQIENEIGLLGDSRDRSAEAEKLFAGEVPSEFIRYLQKNEAQILPEIIEQWKANGKKTRGSWEELFGNGSHNLADELFMGWYYAKFVQRVAAEGKKVYPLPMFVNAWTIYPADPIPGHYPSGGPNYRMLDVYQCAAPSIDFLAVDNYNDDYAGKLKQFYRSGNPIFVPEAVALWRGDKDSGPAKAFYTFAEYNAICFSPFAIDNPAYNANHPLKDAYRVLDNLTPLIAREHGSGKMRGFMQQEGERREKIDFGDYEMNVNYNYPHPGYGLVIRLSEDEFLVSGYGMDISFTSKVTGLTGISYGLIREGYFVDGKWRTSRYLGGDEAMQGVGGVKMPPVYLKEDATPNLVTTVRIRVIPVESTTTDNRNIFD